MTFSYPAAGWLLLSACHAVKLNAWRPVVMIFGTKPYAPISPDLETSITVKAPGTHRVETRCNLFIVFNPQ